MAYMVALVALFLLPFGSIEGIVFSNWNFKTTPFWVKSMEGADLILTPYAQAKSRDSRAEFRPGVPSTEKVDAYFAAEWSRLLSGQTPTVVEPLKQTTFPRNVNG